MRNDIILEFCKGKRPKDLINDKMASPKTIYYYHSIYNNLKQDLSSEEFIDELIKVFINLRMKERGGKANLVRE